MKASLSSPGQSTVVPWSPSPLRPRKPPIWATIRFTIVTSQLPLEKWRNNIGDPTMADAILNRLVHNACKINLIGKSMRKRKSNLTAPMGAE